MWYIPDPAPSPAAEKLMYPRPTTAAMFVLYGVLSLLKRTSRYGRNTFVGPNSADSSPTSSSIGPFTSDRYRSLFASQYAFELSSSSPSKNANASSVQPRNAMAAEVTSRAPPAGIGRRWPRR